MRTSIWGSAPSTGCSIGAFESVPSGGASLLRLAILSFLSRCAIRDLKDNRLIHHVSNGREIRNEAPSDVIRAPGEQNTVRTLHDGHPMSGNNLAVDLYP
jgi:hypothetical protein